MHSKRITRWAKDPCEEAGDKALGCLLSGPLFASVGQKEKVKKLVSKIGTLHGDVI